MSEAVVPADLHIGAGVRVLENNSQKESSILIISIFIAGLCSLIYELLIGTASSYFLGDSVKQFSITIGLYMAAMGLGSLVSRLISVRLLSSFVAIEIILGLVGGISIPLLYFCYAFTDFYLVCMVVLILIIGSLIGLEIPLLIRIMEHYYPLKKNISNVLFVDYLGALCATILFPFVLLPFWGTFKSSLFFGMVNMGIGFLVLWCFKANLQISIRRFYLFTSTITLIFLSVMFYFSNYLLKTWESVLYEDRIIYSQQSKYQKIILTRHKNDLRLFLDGNLQFSSIDEYRYHETLVHIPLSLTSERTNILLLGGGDGLALREIFKYEQVRQVTLVDIDPAVTKMAGDNYWMRRLNHGNLKDQRVKIVHQDAFIFLKNETVLYDVILADLPDPNNASLARLYSREFYHLILRRLSRTGLFMTQATSPFFVPRAFWCINASIKATGLHTRPLHVYVPSFGDWGFVLAAHHFPKSLDFKIKVPTRFLDDDGAAKLFKFPLDLINYNVKSSTLDRPQVLTNYLQGWKHWN